MLAIRCCSVAQEMSCRLGGQVGYAVRFDDCTCEDTKIKFMTDGMLIRELMLDTELKRYSGGGLGFRV